jgi:hypothetical protein
MPRDANGNYTLPSGNPVVSGTPISSTVHNNTNSDIASALADSLSRSGLGGMLVPLQFADGSESNPSITFTAETTTGIFRSGNGEWAVTVLGIESFGVTNTGAYSQNPYYEWNTGLAQFVPLVNAADDYTIAGNWDFTLPLTVSTIIEVGRGKYLFHDDALLPSSAIFISEDTPLDTQGSDGDIWLELEP